MEKIIEIERETNAEVKETILNEIRSAAVTSTHMYVVVSFTNLNFIWAHFSPSVPHYHVVSKAVRAGRLSFVLGYLRALLIESVYRRLGIRCHWISL